MKATAVNSEELVKREKKVIERERKIAHKLKQERQRVFDRFPLLFTLLGAFGLVATFYGFERVIDRIDFFADNPYVLLLFGIGTLLFTGTLYSKLK